MTKYRLRDMKNIDLTSEDLFTWIKADKVNARRIVNRFISKGWWILHQESEGIHTLIISAGIDLQRDIRDKLAGVEFDVE